MEHLDASAVVHVTHETCRTLGIIPKDCEIRMFFVFPSNVANSKSTFNDYVGNVFASNKNNKHPEQHSHTHAPRLP